MNAPGFSVLSGPDRCIDDVEAALGRESVAARRLHTSHAFHSAMMDPILGEFEDIVARIPLSAPAAPFAATLTGDWANGDVTKPRYWSAQLRSTVRFADAVRAVVQKKAPPGRDSIFLEIGPGNTLVTFAAETARGEGATSPCLVSLQRPQDLRSDTEVMLSSLGQLWAGGVPVDWEGFHRTERRSRISLPTYPFERRSYWIGARPGESPASVEHQTRAPAIGFTARYGVKSRWSRRPVDDRAYDVVTNLESSHTYPNLRTFFTEVARVLVSGGTFLYTDLLPVQRWVEVRVLLAPLGFTITDDRHVTPHVLASCDQVAATRAQAFGGSSSMMDNSLAVPGSTVDEQMRSGAWEYRILRARRT